MNDVTLSVEAKPDPHDLEALERGLTEYGRPHTGRDGFLPIAVLARDAEGTLVGGARGKLNWSWLHVATLWVAEALRHQGLGSKLLLALEAEGRARGCTNAHLDTFSYQARPFYERHGYVVFGTLEEYPPGHQRFFLRKVLTEGGA